MRRQKKRKTATLKVLYAAVLLLVVPFTLRWLIYALPQLGRAGENAAMLAAALNMPDMSAQLLRERFEAEIYHPEAEHTKPQPQEPEGDILLPLPPAIQRPKIDTDEPEMQDGLQNGSALTPPRIPEKYSAPIIGQDFSGKEGDTVTSFGSGLIKNETKYDFEEISEILQKPYPIQFSQITEPQVLIVHTHATESFEKYDSETYDTRNTWRSTDNNRNMVAVGDAFTQVLEQNGIGVLHDTTQHDYPSYNGSYERSAETIKAYLEEYPTIKVVLDLHRDAMQREDAIVKPVAVIDGKKAAQIMIISACDDGTMDIPKWRDNLRFAAAYQDYMEQYFPGLTRPVYFCYRKYNMDLTQGSLLLEFGSNGNTLEEATYSATLAAQSLANLIHDNIRAQ